MLRRIPASILDLYKPVSRWESFYLKTRWRLCPFDLLESSLPLKGRILDFGCGYGMLSNLLAQKGPERSVVGIDLNSKRIAVAMRSQAGRSNIFFHLGDVESLDPSPFDGVVMTDVLHHIQDDQVEVLLKKVHKSLGKEGVLAILDVDRKPFWKFCVTYAIDSMLNPGDRLWYRPVHRIQEILSAANLQMVKAVRAHKGLPLADVLLLCRRGPDEDRPDRSP